MKILLGGVPFGRNNIGDEAILACVVRIVREAAPEAALTVSTDDPETAQRLGVNVCPLFGFDVVPYSAEEMRRTLAAHDVYVWSGATGLSDYPDRACEILALAAEVGCRAIVWNVGMNTELNPAKYRLQGRRKAVVSTVDLLTGGVFGWQEKMEREMDRAAREKLKAALETCSLVVTRDPESATELARCDFPKAKVLVGADSALIQTATPWPPAVLKSDMVRNLEEPGRRRVGLCISAQREITRRAELVAALRQLLALPETDIVGLPMNPITDLALLESLREEAGKPSNFQIVPGVTEPDDITCLAGRMDVLISSRLHLLILGSINHVPLIGISRGSKVDNFLAPFGLRAVGSVEDCDFPSLVAETRRLLESRQEFEATSRAVRGVLLEHLDGARGALRAALEGCLK
jgi:polysaccharide pyruvyl transferase WcaK-like protein